MTPYVKTVSVTPYTFKLTPATVVITSPTTYSTLAVKYQKGINISCLSVISSIC